MIDRGRTLLVALTCAFVLACSGSDRAAPSPVVRVDAGETDPEWSTPESFIALDRDFQGYLSWEGFDLGVNSDDAGVHIAGPRSVYINKRPPTGAREFPMGTIVVKAIKNGPPTQWQVFAMVKRGGDFNVFGAIDWEWFELTHATDDLNGAVSSVVSIKWRGIRAPDGETYGGLGGGACNGCHSSGRDNDYVQSPPLQWVAPSR